MPFYAYDLRAVYPDKKIDRFYKIQAQQDLFGLWSVSLFYGRRGTQGHRQHRSFSSQEDALTFVAQKLKTRQAPRKRRGGPYTLLHKLEENGPEEDGAK